MLFSADEVLRKQKPHRFNTTVRAGVGWRLRILRQCEQFWDGELPGRVFEAFTNTRDAMHRDIGIVPGVSYPALTRHPLERKVEEQQMP